MKIKHYPTDYKDLHRFVGSYIAINTILGGTRDPAAIDRIALLVGRLEKYNSRYTPGNPQFALVNPVVYEHETKIAQKEGTFLIYPSTFKHQEPRVLEEDSIDKRAA